jgi:hypothetical protein
MAMMETDGMAATTDRTLPPRDARGRFVARAGAAPKAACFAPLPRRASGRVRSLPARDARGRFVSFPTTNAPSWYVLCADAYRIPSEADVMLHRRDAQPVPPPPPHPLPVAKVVPRRRRPIDWAEVATWMLMAVFIVVVGWHGLHLPRPHR